MKNNESKNALPMHRRLWTTLKRWFRRIFFGAGKELADGIEKRELSEEEARQRAAEGDLAVVVSPLRQIVKGFLERKLAVAALCIIVAMFLFVFIAPMFMPYYDDAYTEVLQKSIPPTMSMMSVPKGLKNDVKMIDSFGSFSVGLSNKGKVYVWGSTKLGTTGLDIADIPREVKSANIVMVAAGFDHIIAIGDDGRVYGWGSNQFGQYKTDEGLESNPNIATIPAEVSSGSLKVSDIKKLVCGYQATAILMNDGTLYIWGNKNAYSNLGSFRDVLQDPLADITFTLNYIVGVRAEADKNGAYIYTGLRGQYTKLRERIKGETKSEVAYLNGRSIVAAEGASTSVCYQLSDGSYCFAGDFKIGVVDLPNLKNGEKFVSIKAGANHYTGLTDKGNVYSFGSNVLGQCDVSYTAKHADVDRIMVGSFQSYAINDKNDVEGKWGLRGYLFGTDTTGADIFQRIANGGRMTMTIGAVAVVISTIIGIIIGCVSGYFGGKIDMLLMRVTEIFAAIPFLPFAMILSALLTRSSLTENGRIFIIMCILGVLSWTGLARLVRGQVLVARENEYVTAAKAMGVKEWKIAFKHILPNVISVILVTLTLDFAGCMLTESSLSYLGFGVVYPRPTWGNMLNGAKNLTIIANFWWQWLFTALFLAITTICINIVGDALRDVMDPKSGAER